MEPKLSQEQKRKNERETEAKMAKEMQWENIFSEIAKRKEQTQTIQGDIDNLVATRSELESQIRHYQRIASFKRKQAGA